MEKIRIVSIDDYRLVRDGIRACISARPNMEIVAEGRAGEDVFPLVEQHRPDVLLLDQKMPQFHSKESSEKFRPLPTIRRLKRQFPDTRIIVISQLIDPVIVHNTVKAGISGYIAKKDPGTNPADVVEVVMKRGLFLSEEAAANYAKSSFTQLTPRQLEVLKAIRDDPTVKYHELANRMDMSESTFKKHLTLAMRRLGVPNNKLAAIQLCETLGLFD